MTAWGDAAKAHRARCEALGRLLTQANGRHVAVEQVEPERGNGRLRIPRSPLCDTPERWGAIVRCDGVVRNLSGEDLDRELANASAGRPLVIPRPREELREDNRPPQAVREWFAQWKATGVCPPPLEGA